MTAAKLFPGTSIKTIFINSPSYAPVFLNTNETGSILGSLNAGNSDSFFVLNSGGINMSFDRAFQGANQYSYMGPDPYVRIHKELFNNASTGNSSKSNFDDSDPLEFAMALRPTTSDTFQGFNGNDGTVFIDIFKSSKVPKQNVNNYAMIYACPPNGPLYASDNDFLMAIKETAKNIVRAVRKYNVHTVSDSNLKVIETVRMCLYSSGLYNRNNVTVDSIALQVLDGLKEELGSDNAGIKQLEFENGMDPKTNKRPYEAVHSLYVNWKDAS